MECVSCVIVTYNANEIIFNVIESVYKQVYKIIIVDNGSNKYTKELLTRITEKYDIDIIYNSSNLGIATALNIGMKQAIKKYKSNWILTLDHDSIATECMIEKMIKCYSNLNEKEKEKIGIIAPEILDISINKSFYKVNNEKKYEEKNSVIQSGSLIKAQLFEKIRFFDEDLFIYFVDIEFCINVIRNGYKIIMVKGAKLFHKEGEKERRKFCGLEFTYDNYSVQAVYYISRNALYMFKKYKKFEFINRIVYDFIKILLAEPKKLKYLFIGVKDAVFNKYGKKIF